MDARVQRLDAAIHHFGEAGIVAHFRHRHAGIAKLLGGTAGREDLDAARGERLTEWNEPGLVGNGNEGSCDADEIGGHDGGILRKAIAEFQVWGGFFSRRSAHLITVESDMVSPVTTT